MELRWRKVTGDAANNPVSEAIQNDEESVAIILATQKSTADSGGGVLGNVRATLGTLVGAVGFFEVPVRVLHSNSRALSRPEGRQQDTCERSST